YAHFQSGGVRQVSCLDAFALRVAVCKQTSVGLGQDLIFVLAQVDDATLWAARLAGNTYVAPMQDEPVVGVAQIFFRNKPFEASLDFKYRLASCQAGAVGHTKDMGVY